MFGSQPILINEISIGLLYNFIEILVDEFKLFSCYETDLFPCLVLFKNTETIHYYLILM